MKNTIQRLYIAILLFAPLAFGTTETWSKTILMGAIFLDALLYFDYIWPRRRSLLVVPGLYFLLGMIGVMLLQVIPLPPLLVKLISPATYHLWQDTLGLTAPAEWMRLSVDLKSTVLSIFQFSAYLLFYVLSVQLLSRAEFLRKVVHIVIGFAALLSFAAVLQHFSMPQKLLWLRETVNLKGGGFGPFANRNHYAGFMIMMFPIAFGMLFYHKPRVTYASWKDKISEFFDYRSTNVYLIMMLAVLLIGVSVFVSLSRGGIVALCFALVMLGFLMAFRAKANRGRGIMVAALFGVLLISVGWFGWEPVFERFSHIRDDQGDISVSRIPAWRDSMDIIGSFPLLGTGAGTFFYTHKAFRKLTPGPGYFVHAHNDYIETAADLGLVGLGLLIGFIVTVLLSYRRFKQRHDRYAIYLYLGAITSFGAILVHCLVEFNLQIGANALYFFFTAALCISAANTRLLGAQKKASFLDKTELPLVKTVGAAIAALLLICGTTFSGGAYLGELNFNNLMKHYDAPDMTAQVFDQIEALCRKAAIYDPLESRTDAILGNVLASREEIDDALESYGNAIRRTPLNGEYLQAAADLYDRKGQRDMAEKFQLAALKYEGANPRVHVNYGFWLIANDDFKKGAEAIRQGISIAPSLSPVFIERLSRLYLPYDTLTTALPDKATPYIALGEFLVESEQMDLARLAYATAYENIANEEPISPAVILKLYKFYNDQDMEDEALKVVSTGVERLPDNSWLRYTLGQVYEKIGIIYRALEEYERALVLDPKNHSARLRLVHLED